MRRPRSEDPHRREQKLIKNLVKIKFALDLLNESKFRHSKMENSIYTELKIQEYLTTETMSVEGKGISFTTEQEWQNF